MSHDGEAELVGALEHAGREDAACLAVDTGGVDEEVTRDVFAQPR